MSGARELFKKIGSASLSSGGVYYRRGRGKVVVLEDIFSPDAKGGPTFIGKHLILESTKVPSTDASKWPDVEPNAPGEVVSYVQQLAKFDSAMGNVRGYLLKMLGLSENSVSAEEFAETLEEAVGPQKMTRGFVIEFYTVDKLTKAGAPRTYVQFSVAKGNSKDEVAERRKKLDETHPLQK